jgi:hypothetical protein
MKAILSDVHGNLEALQAVLQDAAWHHADAIYCLGDLVGYGGPDPCGCLELALTWPVVLLGNHDRAVFYDPVGIPGQKAHWWVPREALARVVRELFPYPFGPDPFCDEWLTTTVVALAESIDARKSFEDMPVLGDALEEAGCTAEGVLRHCRHETYHLRGCWVLDSLQRRRAGCWRDRYRASDRAHAAKIPPEKVRDLLRPREEFPGGAAPGAQGSARRDGGDGRWCGGVRRGAGT